MKQIDTQVICSQRDVWYPKKKVEFLLVIQIAFRTASISGHSPVSVTVTTRRCPPGSRCIPLSLRLSSLSPILPLRPPLCHRCHYSHQVSSHLLQPLPSSAFYTCCSPFFPNPFSKDHCRSWVFFMPLGGKKNKTTNTNHRRSTAFQERISSATRSQRTVNKTRIKPKTAFGHRYTMSHR